MIILGIAGLFAHLVVAVPPQSAAAVTSGSWVAIGIGVVLLLTALAQNGYGYGIFLLTLGVGAVVAHQVAHLDDRIHAPQPLFGIVAASLAGVGAVAVSYSGGTDGACPRLLFFATASLLADIFVDFGSGWDSLMNVSTAFFAAAFVATAAWEITADSSADRDSVAAHYGSRLLQAGGIGVGVAAVLITVEAAFILPSFVDTLLVLGAVFGVYPLVLQLGFGWLHLLVGGETMDHAPKEMIEKGIEGMENGVALLAALVAGFVFVTVLAGLIFGEPTGWQVAVLVVAAVVAIVAMVGWGYRAVTELARWLKGTPLPGRVAKVLDDLRLSDPVFRLLPGSEKC